MIGIASTIATRSPAQDVVSPPQTPLAPADASPMAAQQVDQLVAPVALYNDPLLADVLTASSYPVELVDAQRWIANPANAALKDAAVATGLASQAWNSSVNALLSFPQ